MMRLAPEGTTVHFSRMVAAGATGSQEGQEERNLSQVAHIEATASLLALVEPAVLVMAHTATSYTLGTEREAALVRRMELLTGIPFITAFGSVVQALNHLGVRRIALVTPYSQEWTRRGKVHLEAHGFDVVSSGSLENVGNIYDETPQRAREAALRIDVPGAEALFISGVGMPTIEVLDTLEVDLVKPVLSAASAMMWNALRVAGVSARVPGYGMLLSGDAGRTSQPPRNTP